MIIKENKYNFIANNAINETKNAISYTALFRYSAIHTFIQKIYKLLF